MIELQVMGGCQADGPCEQGTLDGKGFFVVTEVDVKDQSVYDDAAFSPQLIDKETGMPFMESIMTRFPTMDFTCPFCGAPTKVNGVTNMESGAIEVDTDVAREQINASRETMQESDPWDDPIEDDPIEEDPLEEDPLEDDPAIDDPLAGDPANDPLAEDDPLSGEDPLLDEEPLDEEPLGEDEEPLDEEELDDPLSSQNDNVNPDDPIIV